MNFDTAQTHPISKLKMQIAWLGMKPQVDTLSIVPDNVFSTRILIVATTHKLLHAKGQKENLLYCKTS